MKMEKEILKCPNCKSKNITGREDPYIYDGVIEWVCVDCGYGWDRFTGKQTRESTYPLPFDSPDNDGQYP